MRFLSPAIMVLAAFIVVSCSSTAPTVEREPIQHRYGGVSLNDPEEVRYYASDPELEPLTKLPADSLGLTGATRCTGTTQAGNRCLRRVANGTLCWQHLNTPPSADVGSSGGGSGSGTIHTGPRGGKYTISPSGKKVYQRKKK